MLWLLCTTTSTLLADKTEHLHNIYGLLTKCEVKMAGKRSRPISDRTSLVNKRFVAIFVRDPAGNPERASSAIFD